MATRYRDLENRTLIDVGARSTPTGAPNTAQALAESFSAFSRTSAEVGSLAQKFAAQKSAEAGTKEGLAGKPEFRKGIRSLTAVGRAYNSAAETSYVAQAQTDIDSTMTRLEQDSEADAEGFDAKAKAYADSLLAEAPPEMRPIIEHVLTARTAAGANRVRAQVIAKTNAQASADYLSSVPSVIRNAIAAATELPPEQADEALALAVSDNEARLDALVQHNVIGPEEAVRLKTAFHKAMDEGLTAARTEPMIERLTNLARNDVQAGDIALAALEKRDDLSFDDKTAIRKGYETQRNLLTFERSRQFVEESGDLAKRLAGGATGADAEAENLALYKHGAISVDEYQANQATIQRNADKKDGEGIDIAAVQNSLDTGRGLDPSNAKIRQAVDTYFNAAVTAAGITPGDPRWQAAAIDMAHRTNILPASAQSWARVNMMSGDPVQVANGATFFKRAQDANPVSWNYDDDPKIAAFAEQINASLEGGVVTERALDMARHNVYEMTDAQRDMIKQQYATDKVAKTNHDAFIASVSSEFKPHWYSSVPAPSKAMEAEYNGLVEQMYSFNGGDVEQARKLAFDAMKSRYGTSMVNGKPEILKYAPEKMYGMPADVVRNDMTEVVKTHAPEADSTKVVLTPVPATERTKGRVWLLQTPDEYGALDTVRDANNQPVLYELPVGQAFDDARNRLLEAKRKEAEQKRESLLPLDEAQRKLREQDLSGLTEGRP